MANVSGFLQYSLQAQTADTKKPHSSGFRLKRNLGSIHLWIDYANLRHDLVVLYMAEKATVIFHHTTDTLTGLTLSAIRLQC